VLLTPFLVTAGLIINKYLDSPGHWTGLVRPTLVAWLAIVLGLGLLRLVKQSAGRSAAFMVLLLLLASGARSAIAVALAAAFIVLVKKARGGATPRLRPVVAVGLAGAFVGIGIAQLFVSGAVTRDDIVQPPVTRGVATADAPNIYVLLLDAYGRQDTLAAMGLDNEPFLAELEARGFDVYRDSRSNYTWTSSTMASMLNMRPLSEIAGLPPPGSSDREQTRALRRAINDGEGIKRLREHGYRIVSIPSVTGYEIPRDVDELRDSGQLTEFEIHLLQSTTLAGVLEFVAPDFIGAQDRDRIRATFRELKPERAPAFVLAHVMAPHQPFVFWADGEPRAMPDCFPACWFWEPWDVPSPEAFSAAYVAQVGYVNRQTLAAVDRLIASDPAAVVVVFGDHGSRGIPSDPAEAFRNLMAVRSLGHPHVLGAAPTLVNLLGSILNAYLGVDVPRWPDDQFAGRHLDAVRIAPVD
jgi:hypothetical protein